MQNNFMKDAQASFIRKLILEITGLTRLEIAGKTFIMTVNAGEFNEDKTILRIKKDGTFDKNFVNKVQASGLIETLLEHKQNNPVFNAARKIEVK